MDAEKFAEAVRQIRHDLVVAHAKSRDAKTLVRDRTRHSGMAYAYAQALLHLTADQPPVTGIAGSTFYSSQVADARTWLGSDADKILGPVT